MRRHVHEVGVIPYGALSDLIYFFRFGFFVTYLSGIEFVRHTDGLFAMTATIPSHSF